MKRTHLYAGIAALATCTFSAVLIGTNSGMTNKINAQNITCAHKNTVHHDEVEPTYFDNGVKEYWGCCDCHSKFDHEPTAYDTDVIENTLGFDPYDSSDGRHLDKKLFRTENPVIASYTEVEATGSNTLPSGYEHVYKYSANGSVLGRFADVRLTNFNYIKFAVRSDAGSGKWFEMIPDYKSTAVSKGSVEASNVTNWYEYRFDRKSDGSFELKNPTATSTEKYDYNFSLDNLKVKFNGDWYMTEIVGEMKDKNYISEVVKIDDNVGSFMSSGTVLSEQTMIDSNLYSTVKQKNCSWSSSGNPLVSVNLSKYKEVFFKYYCDNQYTTFFLSDGTQLFKEDKTGFGWITFKLLKQEDGSFNIEYRNDPLEKGASYKENHFCVNVEISNLNELKMKTASASYNFSALFGVKEPASTEIISTNIFNNLVNTETTVDELYPTVEIDEINKAYKFVPLYGKDYTFVSTNLSLYDNVYFYYRTNAQGWFTFSDAETGAEYVYQLNLGSVSTAWNLFEFTYNTVSNSWTLNVNNKTITGLEIADLSVINVHISGVPDFYASPLFGHRTKTSHSLNPHSLAGSGYQLVSDNYINFSGSSISNNKTNYILADSYNTYSIVATTRSSQILDIRFNDIALDDYDEVYFKLRRIEAQGENWFELGTIASGGYKNVLQTNSAQWQEIKLKRVDDGNSITFDVYANGTKKLNISSLTELHFKLYNTYAFSPILGIEHHEVLNNLINSDLTTDYKVVFWTDSGNYDRYTRHSAEVLRDTLNTATGKNADNGGFTSNSISSIDNNKKYIVLGEKAANEAGFTSSDLGGLDYRIISKGNCVYIFGNSRNGTHNGVQAFLNKYCDYEYFYKNVETITPITTSIQLEKFEIVKHFDFDMAWDVQSETRYDYSSTGGGDVKYQLDAGFMIDYGGEAGYKIDGGWHNEDDFHNAMNVPYVKAGSATNHVNLEASGVDEKVATYLYNKYGSDPNKIYLRFSLNDDYAWYNTTDDYQTRTNKYFNFMNSVATKLDAMIDHDIYLVSCAYHFTEYCPTDWVPYEGYHVKTAVFYCPSNMVFCAEPNSSYCDRTVNTWNHMTSSNDKTMNPYQNWLKWEALGKQYDIKMFVYLYNSLCNYFAPFDVISHMSSYYKLCHSTGIDILYDQGQYSQSVGTNWTRLKTYLNHKLSLNVNENVDDLVKRFMKAYFGNAWEGMYNMLQKEITTLNNPVYNTSDYANYYGGGTSKTSLPLQLRGIYWGNGTKSSNRGDRIFVNSGTGMLDYYDAALTAAGSNQTIIDRVKLEGLAIRYWFVACCTNYSSYGYTLSYHKINGANDSFATIKSDALGLGVLHIGENLELSSNNLS